MYQHAGQETQAEKKKKKVQNISNVDTISNNLKLPFSVPSPLSEEFL